jgi:hypothetical protein
MQPNKDQIIASASTIENSCEDIICLIDFVLKQLRDGRKGALARGKTAQADEYSIWIAVLCGVKLMALDSIYEIDNIHAANSGLIEPECLS